MATSTLQYLYQHLSTYDHYTLDIVFLIAVISVFPYLLICYFLKSTPSTTRVDTKKNDEEKPIIQPQPEPQHTKEEEILSPVITILPPPKIIKKQSIDLESQNKKQIQNTISELLSTEQTYIHQLETLNTMFIQPIQNQKLIKNQKVFDTIFPIDIQIITRTNQQFFHHLKHIIQLYSLSDKSLNSFSSFSRSQTSTPISPTSTTTTTTTTTTEQQLNHTNHNDNNNNNSMENDEGDELLKMDEEEEDVEQMSEYAHNTTNSQTESENDSDDNSSTTSSSDDIEEAEPVMNDLDVESTTTTTTSTTTTISPIATPRETTNTTPTSTTSTTSPSLVISSNLHLDIDINQSQLYNIGHLFNHYSKLFRLYVGYISKYQNCVRTLEMECEKNKKLNSFLSAQMNQLMQLNQNTMIYDYLITMIQRIPRYQLLLQDLMRHIELKPSQQQQQQSSDENNEVEEVEDVNQSTRTILSHALESIKHTAKYCNEKEREVHMLLKLFQIEKSLPQKYLMKSSSSNNSGHHSISELSNGGEQNTNRRVLLEVYNQMTHHHEDDGYDNGGEDAADALLNTTVHYYSLKKKRFRPMGELFLCNDCLLFEKEKKRISNMKKRRKSSKKKSLVAAVVTTMSSQKRKEDYYHIQYWKLRSVTHYGTVVNVQLNLNYQNESNVFQLVTTFEQQSSQQSSQHVFMSRRKSAHESTASSTSTTADHNNSSSGGGSSVTHQCVIRCPSTYSYNQITSVISELIK